MHKLPFFLFVFILIAIRSNGQGVTGNEQNSGIQGATRPLLVGHRGGFDAILPENSISMFDYTFSQVTRKPVAVEFDIRKSASGSLYLMHDSTVDRTTNGTGSITRLTDDYLESLFLKDKKGNLTAEKIPLFTDVLQHFYDKNIMLMLDVKGDILPEVIKATRQTGMESRCILLTFNRKNLLLAKENTSRMMISALVGSAHDLAQLQAAEIPGEQLIVYISEKTPESVIKALQSESITLMADMSEGLRNNSQVYERDFYRNKVLKLNLGILITDYPVEAARTFDIGKP
jgi:glycerophosphoryl diester phosphodiesterase